MEKKQDRREELNTDKKKSNLHPHLRSLTSHSHRLKKDWQPVLQALFMWFPKVIWFYERNVYFVTWQLATFWHYAWEVSIFLCWVSQNIIAPIWTQLQHLGFVETVLSSGGGNKLLLTFLDLAKQEAGKWECHISDVFVHAKAPSDSRALCYFSFFLKSFTWWFPSRNLSVSHNKCVCAFR